MRNSLIKTTLLLIVLSMTACSDKMGVEVGQKAPLFRLETLRGGAFNLEGLEGKVVLVNFWATWCGPCKEEMPSMQTLYRSFKREDFEILAVSIDIDGVAAVRDFVGKFGFTFPILLDTKLTVNEMYQIRVVPTSVLIDRNGIVREHILGAKDWSDPEIRLRIHNLVKMKGQ
ncbi:MAG: TlpA disulfide reductase family protein [Nitrospirota bacterium]